MSEPGTRVTLSRVAWLLLLPALALPIAWGVRSLPLPESTAPGSTTAPATATPAVPASGYPPVSSTAPEVRIIETSAAEPQTEPAPRQTEPAPVELSSWTTMDGALEESRRNGKPVFIDFSADWCGPCQRLKHEVFEDGTRAATLQGAVIPVSIVDQRRESGTNPPEIEELQQRYHVEAFPTLVVFSPATGRVVTTRGFRGADATLAWITEAAKSVR